MSTTTAPAELEVPIEILALLRENIRTSLEALGDQLSHVAGLDDGVEEVCDELEHAIDARRAFSQDADAFPSAAVRAAAGYVIADHASRISDDHLSVDEAELLVRRVRLCESLIEQADGVTA